MILCLYGDDTFRSRRKLDELQAKFLRDIDPSGMNLAKFEAAEAEPSEIDAAISSAPFLAKKRMVVLKNPFILAKKRKTLDKELIRIADRVPEETIFIVFEEVSGEMLKGIRSFDEMRNPKFYPEFSPLSPRDLRKWAEDEAGARGLRFEPGVLEAYLRTAGNDLWKISNEIDALASYIVGRPAKTEDLAHLTDARIQAGIFDFLDAVGAKRVDAATRILEALLEQGESEVSVLTRLQSHFRNLLVCADMTRHGVADRERLSRELGIHPFVATKAMAQSRYFSADELERLYKTLIDADERLKSGGWAKPRMAIDLFLLELTSS